MEQDTIQILVLAFIAGIVLFRLYTTLGKRTGEERHEPAPAQGELPRTPVQTPAAPSASVSVAGIAAVERADPNFEPGYVIPTMIDKIKAVFRMEEVDAAGGDSDA